MGHCRSASGDSPGATFGAGVLPRSNHSPHRGRFHLLPGTPGEPGYPDSIRGPLTFLILISLRTSPLFFLPLIILSLGGTSLGAQAPRGRGPAIGTLTEVAQPGIRYEVEVLPGLLKAKFRVRDGEPSLMGTSIFSREMGDVESSEFAPGVVVRAIMGQERFSLRYWTMKVEGRDTLSTSRNWGGSVISAGTPIDADISYEYLELDWRHRFELTDKLWFDAGLAVEYLAFDADLGFGSTRLSGVYPVPRLGLVARPVDWLEVDVSVGGFNIPFVNGSTDILDPREITAGLRVLGEKWSAGLSWGLHHVHLEENSGDIDEDVVHSRLSGVTLSLSVRF